MKLVHKINRFSVFRIEMRRVVVVLCLFTLPLLAGDAPGVFSAKRDDGGMNVELRLRTLGGTPFRESDPVNVDLRITDASGKPVPGMTPAAWMSIRSADGRTARDRCVANTATFVSGNLFIRPEVDLNAYQVLAMNGDATINVVDPRFGFGGTQLLSIITLKAPAEDWTLNRDASLLFISTPKTGEVAVADTTSWKVTRTIAAGPNARRVVLQPDGHYLWVAHDEGVTVLRGDRGDIAARIATPAPVHELVATPDNAYVVAVNGTKASIVSVNTLKTHATIAADAAIVSAAVSPRGGFVYLAADSGTVLVVDPKAGRVVRTLRVAEHPVQIRFEPEGRFAFVVNTQHRTVEIIDSAANAVIQTADVDKDPDRISFSRHLAYVRHLGSDIVLTIPLDKIGTRGDGVPIIDVPAGQEKFGGGPPLSIADGIVQAGEEDAVLIAHPVDKEIYYYREGMAAPMGHFSNYGHSPRAVMVIDRSLREQKTGEFHTTARLGRAGLYDVAVFVDSPRIVTCFEVAVAENETMRAERMKPLKVSPLVASETIKAGAPLRLRFLVSDQTNAPKPGLADVTALIVSTGTWHTHAGATSIGNGVYEVEFVPPSDGVYTVYVECPSAGLAVNQGRLIVLNAKS